MPADISDVAHITLRDGRKLAYAEYGDPQGHPVLYFHGTPGSRLERHPDDSIVRDRGVRLITADRPGYGRSDFQTDRTFLDWPSDVAQLADALSLDKFAVCGWSGGTPHAMACAFKIPDRITNVGLISGTVPFDMPGVMHGMSADFQIEFAIAHRLPWQLVRQVWKPISATLGYEAATNYGRLVSLMKEPERSELGAPGVSTILGHSIAEAYRQGPDGEAWEDKILASPWGFTPPDIEIPVFTWHGLADTMAPPSMGRALEESLRYGHTTWYEGVGHGMWFMHWPTILDTLLAPRPAVT